MYFLFTNEFPFRTRTFTYDLSSLLSADLRSTHLFSMLCFLRLLKWLSNFFLQIFTVIIVVCLVFTKLFVKKHSKMS